MFLYLPEKYLRFYRKKISHKVKFKRNSVKKMSHFLQVSYGLNIGFLCKFLKQWMCTILFRKPQIMWHLSVTDFIRNIWLMSGSLHVSDNICCRKHGFSRSENHAKCHICRPHKSIWLIYYLPANIAFQAFRQSFPWRTWYQPQAPGYLYVKDGIAEISTHLPLYYLKK